MHLLKYFICSLDVYSSKLQIHLCTFFYLFFFVFCCKIKLQLNVYNSSIVARQTIFFCFSLFLCLNTFFFVHFLLVWKTSWCVRSKILHLQNKAKHTHTHQFPLPTPFLLFVLPLSPPPSHHSTTEVGRGWWLHKKKRKETQHTPYGRPIPWRESGHRMHARERC